jgi:hypothetical protein
MSWITPTEANILTRLSGAEMGAFRSAALGTAQADPVAAQITTVVDFIRGYLRRCSQHTMGADGTIPKEALSVFLDLIVPIIQMRPAGALIDSSGIRMDARSDANKWLTAAAKCEILFDDSVPAQMPDHGPVNSPSFSRRQRSRGRIEG